MKHHYGPWALILGGSEGIGGAWADHLARHGVSIALIARNEDKLAAKRIELVETHGVEVHTISVDLGSSEAPEHIIAAMGDREVGFLVANAATATVGGFFAEDLAFERARLNVNCWTPYALTHHYGALMKQRRRGGIVWMSSGTGLIGAPYYCHYGATKAYDIVLAEGLWYELRDDDVHVLACIAGLTRTPGPAEAFEVAEARGEHIMTAEEVVAEAVAVLGDEPSIIVGEPNRQNMELVTKHLTRKNGVSALGQHALANFLDNQRP
jgi:uncharacterized protein